MRVRVLFFGQLKEIVGRSEDLIEIAEGARVQDLFERLGQQHPKFAGFRGSVVASVNQEFAAADSTIKDNDEVAFLPPVSGGEPAGGDVVKLVRERIAVEKIVASLKAAEDGAVLAFEGIVRNHSSPHSSGHSSGRAAGQPSRRTLYLDYEAYEPMALVKMQKIAEAVHARFAVDGVALVHRLGRLEIGETSVLIVVTSAHRGAAFDGCRWAIDTLKREVPIWKKEYFEGGAVWAEGELPGDVGPLPSKSGHAESV